jgi:transketolase
VVLGDSEMSEGSIWEAFDHARSYRLGNLTAILDMNRLGQRGETPLGWNAAAYAERARAFGWQAIEIDGHDVVAIDRAYRQAARDPDLPAIVIARTIKGKGVPAVEDKNGWHGKVLDEKQIAKPIADMGGQRDNVVHLPQPVERPRAPASGPRPLTLPSYDHSKPVATRTAYGQALQALGDARPEVVALDGEVNNSTCSALFAKAHADRYFEMFISEQQMVAAAVGLSVRGFSPFVSSFAAFLTRAFDFVRMAAVSRANVKLCGSHAGVSIGEDGPSQMGLEDLAMMRAVHGSTVLYPCCANQTARLVAAMADTKGIVYLRTTREATPVIYEPAEPFAPGGSKVLREAPGDVVTVIAAGVTVHEALAASDELKKRGIAVRVVDAYSVQPLDGATIRRCALETGGNVVVVEDHWALGGLGEAVLTCLGGLEPVPARVVHLAVREMPGSGTPEELRRAAGVDAEAVVQACLALVAANGVPAEPVDGSAPSPADFVREVASRAALPANVTVEAAALTVMSHLAERLTPGGAHMLLHALPEPLRPLLQPSVERRRGSPTTLDRPELLERTAEHLGITPLHAEAVCRAVLTSVRESLRPEDAQHVAAQLPADLKELWCSHAPTVSTPISPPNEPDALRAAVLAEIERGAGALPSGIDGTAAFMAVMCIFGQRLSGGEARHVLLALPGPLRSLVTACMLHRAEPADAFPRDEFLRRVSVHLNTDVQASERVVCAVFTAVKSCLPTREIQDVASQLPQDLRTLWLGR